jgi:hypothetical protein
MSALLRFLRTAPSEFPNPDLMNHEVEHELAPRLDDAAGKGGSWLVALVVALSTVAVIALSAATLPA